MINKNKFNKKTKWINNQVEWETCWIKKHMSKKQVEQKTSWIRTGWV